MQEELLLPSEWVKNPNFKILEKLLSYCDTHDLQVCLNESEYELCISNLDQHWLEIAAVFCGPEVLSKTAECDQNDPTFISVEIMFVDSRKLRLKTLKTTLWVGHRVMFTRPLGSDGGISRTLPVVRANTTSEWIRHVENGEQIKRPFIIRETNLLECSPERFEDLAREQQTLLKAYSSSLSWDFAQLRVADVIASWRKNNLNENIVDAPIDAQEMLMPLPMQTYLKEKLKDNYHYALCWIFTTAPKVTHFHTDPTYAGGYMKLLEGEKIWWLVAPDDYQYLVERGHTVESLAQLEFSEIIALENGYLVGRIYADILRKGDLLWFPINTLHKVITTKSSFGFGGYF